MTYGPSATGAYCRPILGGDGNISGFICEERPTGKPGEGWYNGARPGTYGMSGPLWPVKPPVPPPVQPPPVQPPPVQPPPVQPPPVQPPPVQPPPVQPPPRQGGGQVITGDFGREQQTGCDTANALPVIEDAFTQKYRIRPDDFFRSPSVGHLIPLPVFTADAWDGSPDPWSSVEFGHFPHVVKNDDGSYAVIHDGTASGSVMFSPPELFGWHAYGDGVLPNSKWPAIVSGHSLLVLSGQRANTEHGQSASGIFGQGLASLMERYPSNGWYVGLDHDDGSASFWGTDGDGGQVSTKPFTFNGHIRLPGVGAPPTPPTGFGALYFKTDGRVYAKNDAGTEYDLTEVGSGSGLGDPGGNGIVVRTALNTTTNRTIALAVDGALAVSNGDGVAGNPTIGIDIPSLPAPTGAIDDNDDYVVIWSDADSAHRKIPLSDLPAGSGTGDVSGPGIGNSTVGAIPTWGTTDGDELTDSVVIMDPVTGDVAGVNDFATTGATALGTVTPAQITGNQLAYTGLAPGTTAILDGDAEHRIQSIEAPANDGQIHTVYNDGLYNIIFENESPSETGSDSRKINTGTGTDFVLAPGTQATLFWSAATNRWHIKGCADRIPSHTPGAPSHNAPGGSLAFRTDNGRAYLQTSSAVSNNWFALAFDGDFQPLNSNLTALAGLASAADRLPYFTGSGTASLAVFTAAGRNLLDDADATTMLSTLGLSDNGKSLVTAANYAAMRGLLDLEAGTDFPSLSTFNSHNTRHQAGEDDAIKLDDLAAPDDNTDLNASTSAHGLLRKLSNTATEFLNGQGDWATPNVNVRKNSTGSVHARPRINFIEGSNVTLTVADDGTDNEIDVTIAASASGGGLPDPGANGIVVRNSATPTTVNRSIAANTADSAKGIVVSDGDGVAGDPTIGLNITSLATETVIGGDDYFPYAKYTGSYANSKIKLVDIARAASRAQQARLAGNLASTGTTPINSNLSFDLVTGRSYRFRCVLFYTHTNSGGSVGARFDFNGSATFSSAIVGGYFSSSLNANVQRISSAGYNTSLATDIDTTAASGTVTGVMVLEGSCACNGSGTLVLRHGRTAGGSHTSSLLAGSTMEVYEVLDA